jgi:hypothetical protein
MLVEELVEVGTILAYRDHAFKRVSLSLEILNPSDRPFPDNKRDSEGMADAPRRRKVGSPKSGYTSERMCARLRQGNQERDL